MNGSQPKGEKRVQPVGRSILWKVLAVVVFQSVLAAAFWLGAEYRKFRSDLARREAEYVQSQKTMIRHEVESVLDYIVFKRSQNQARIRAELRERVGMALDVAGNLYRSLAARNPAEVRNRIKSALGAMRFDGGNNNFFIVDLDGRSVLNPGDPTLEGRDLSRIADQDGTLVVRRLVEICRRDGEGLLRYRWPRPHGPSQSQFYKISFCRIFAPLNWIVGTGTYEADMTATIQQEILDRVATIRFDTDRKNYIFVVSYEGVTLMNDTQRHLIGKNIWNMTDPNGVKVIQEERWAAERGGDFIHYAWQKPGTDAIAPKVSYVAGVADWRWMVGAGVYLDNIDQVIGQLRREMLAAMSRRLFWIALLVLLATGAALIAARYVTVGLNRQFAVFNSFFRDAAHGSVRLDSSRLGFSEMREMAESANLMITRRDAAEEALLEETERLDITLRSIGEAVVTTDRDGRIGLFNNIAETLVGCQSAAAAGRPLGEVFELLDEATRKPLESPVQRALEKGEAQTAVHSALLRTREGKTRLISYNAAPIQDHQKRVIGSIFVFRDITERRRMDDELNKMQKIESIGLLAGGIAHDFNNLLAAVSGNISLARLNTAPEASSLSFLGKAEAALARAQDLTYQLLTFSKGGDPIQKSLPLEKLVRDVVSFSLHGSRTACSVDAPAGLWTVFIDPGQISQVIQNLIINADQAMPDGGTIRIRLKNSLVDESRFIPLKPGRYVCLTINDQGVGIPADNLKKIFDPFFTTKEHGTGLGLAVVYSIVKKHGGYIDVASEVKAGTTFFIYLPAGEEGMEAEAAEGADSLRRGSGRILVMDDEPLVLELIGNQLRHLGYDPVLAVDDRQALEAFRASLAGHSPFAAIIMDLTIPGGRGGRELAAEILAIKPGQTLIVTSGYSTDPIMADFRRYGFQGRLVKPFSIQNLSQVLASATRSPSAAKAGGTAALS